MKPTVAIRPLVSQSKSMTDSPSIKLWVTKEDGINDDSESPTLFFGGLGSLVCGLLAHRVVQWLGSIAKARRALAMTGFFGAGVMLCISIQMQHPLTTIVFLGLASFCNDLVMPGSWTTCMDVGGKYAGTLSGSMNMMGNLAGFVGPVVGGYILEATGGQYEIFLYSMAAMYLIGLLCWPFINPTKPLEHSY